MPPEDAQDERPETSAVLGNVLQPEIHELIEAKSFGPLKAALAEMEIHDLVELLGRQEEEDLAVCFRLLPLDRATEVFGDLELDKQEDLVQSLSSEKLASILNEMPPDDRTELLEELPGELAQRLLSSLRGEELKIARSLLAYPEDSIGRLMTPEYVPVHPEWDTQQVFAHVRKVGSSKETLSVLYVIDEHGLLLDEVTLEQLVLAEPEQKVADLTDGQVVALHATDDQESALEIFKKYDAVVLPVVNSQGVLVGIVTVDDVLDVAEEESTEDFQKMVAVAALEGGYFQTPYARMLTKRVPWLALLFVAELLTALSLSAFERSMGEKLLLLVMFMPLVNASAGNTGSQMAGLIIRGLAVQEMDVGDWMRVCLRELRMGLSLGAMLAALAVLAAMLFGRPWYVALAVGLAMLIALTIANLAGSMIPLGLKRLRLDPAVTSAPLIASLMDVLSVVIYFSIAMALLSQLD